MAASLARLARSAPEKPGVPRATTFRSTSGASCLSAAVHGQDGRPLGQRRQRDRDLPVEPARPQQRRVEHLGPVGRGEHDDALGHVEAVHLGQQLVQRLLALVVGHRRARAGPALADGVDLVDEDDRGRPLARLGEQVAHPRGADADEQLDEAGARPRRRTAPRPRRPRPGPAGSCRCRAGRSSARRAAPWPRPAGSAGGCAGSRPPRRSPPWRPRSPATSENLVLGRSASNTLARDRPTPSTPCSPPAPPPAALAIRRNTQKIRIRGRIRIEPGQQDRAQAGAGRVES